MSRSVNSLKRRAFMHLYEATKIPASKTRKIIKRLKLAELNTDLADSIEKLISYEKQKLLKDNKKNTE